MSCEAMWLLSVILCVSGLVFGNKEDFRKIDSIHPEDPCSEVGGMCTIAVDCPPAKLSKEWGLCPEQKHEGIECCHGVSMKETRCAKNGGTCLNMAETYCQPQLIYESATDCGSFELCCILV